ncbi:MAG: AbrB/MazE/SpoVT family DNA-binding domain-containing protein [Nocardioides sp.]|uniref:AbrB/MazE/SpoVT family DNA-binding domain-containing protein n=1 Tax=Nocardioides sp. TaxID=35761 RepID=UPI003D6B8589
MTQAVMTSKGQITIPKDVRDDLRLEAGSKVMFVRLGPREYRLVARTGKISDLYGVLARPGQRSLTAEEINEAIADAASESGGS